MFEKVSELIGKVRPLPSRTGTAQALSEQGRHKLRKKGLTVVRDRDRDSVHFLASHRNWLLALGREWCVGQLNFLPFASLLLVLDLGRPSVQVKLHWHCTTSGQKKTLSQSRHTYHSPPKQACWSTRCRCLQSAP